MDTLLGTKRSTNSNMVNVSFCQGIFEDDFPFSKFILIAFAYMLTLWSASFVLLLASNQHIIYELYCILCIGHTHFFKCSFYIVSLLYTLNFPANPTVQFHVQGQECRKKYPLIKEQLLETVANNCTMLVDSLHGPWC